MVRTSPGPVDSCLLLVGAPRRRTRGPRSGLAQRPVRSGGRTPARLFALALALPLAGLLALATACGDEKGISIEDVKEHPDRYVGRMVNLHGEVESVHGLGLFTLGGSGPLGHEILVWTPEEAAVAEGREVWVSGPVRRLVVAEVERELGIDLDAELELAFEREPVMMSGDVVVERDGAP